MGTTIKKELLRFISEDIQNGDITSALLPKKKIKSKIAKTLKITEKGKYALKVT